MNPALTNYRGTIPRPLMALIAISWLGWAAPLTAGIAVEHRGALGNCLERTGGMTERYQFDFTVIPQPRVSPNMQLASIRATQGLVESLPEESVQPDIESLDRSEPREPTDTEQEYSSQFWNRGVQLLSSLEPRLSTVLEWDDNRTRSSGNQGSGMRTVISPELTLRRRYERTQLEAHYRMEMGRDFDKAGTNHIDHHLFGDLLVKMGRKGQLVMRGQYETSQNGVGHHILWGTNSNSSGSWSERVRGEDTFDFVVADIGFELEETGFGAAYYHGDRADRSRFEVVADRRSLRFGRVGSLLILGDRDTINLRSAWFWHLTRRLSVFGEGIFRDTDYVDLPWEADEVRFNLGSEFRFGPRFSGVARLGRQRVHFTEFDDESDYRSPNWALDLRWRPGARSQLALSVSADEEVNQSASNLDRSTTNLGIAWVQYWTPRLVSRLHYTTQDIEFRSHQSGSELDKWSLRAGYQLSRRVVLSFDGSYESGSVVSDADFNRLVMTVRSEMTF